MGYKVLKFTLKIRIDDFNTFCMGHEEISERSLGEKNYAYIARRIIDDRNFWKQECIRQDDIATSTTDAL